MSTTKDAEQRVVRRHSTTMQVAVRFRTGRRHLIAALLHEGEHPTSRNAMLAVLRSYLQDRGEHEVWDDSPWEDFTQDDFEIAEGIVDHLFPELRRRV